MNSPENPDELDASANRRGEQRDRRDEDRRIGNNERGGDRRADNRRDGEKASG